MVAHPPAAALAPLVQQMQVTSVPTMFLIFNGRMLDVKQGVPPKEVRVGGGMCVGSVGGRGGTRAMSGHQRLPQCC